MNKPSRRIDWVDDARGLGIALVVAGHVIGGLEGSNVLPAGSPFSFARAWMYAFHMPAFFVLSGLFVTQGIERGYGKFLLAKIRVLVYPYFVWTVLLWSCHMVMSRYTNTAPDPLQLLKIFHDPYMDLWFLHTLFLCTIIFVLLHALRMRPEVMFLVGVVMLAIHAAGWIGMVWIDRVFVFFIYFAAGAMLQARVIPSFRNTTPAMAALLAVIGFGGLAFLIAQSLRIFHDTFIPYALGPTQAYAFLQAVLGCVGLYGISALLAPISAFYFIRWWGAESLAIFLAHGIPSVLMRITLHRLHLDNAILQFTAGVAFGIAAPLLLKVICDKLNFPYLFRPDRPRKRTPLDSSEPAPLLVEQ